MRIIFRYECRRLMWNRFFFGFLLILLLYGWQVLDEVTILGISHTAPFSPWSFGDYLSRQLPLLWAGTLFLLTFFTSGKARSLSVLTSACPMNPKRYAAARLAAALAGTSLLSFVVLAEAATFYLIRFQWAGWGSLASSALVTLAPPLVFALGSGWILGNIRPWLLFAWMAVPIICRFLPLPDALGMWNGSFFSRYPLTLELPDPGFLVPGPVLAVQGAFWAAGVILGGIIIFPRKNTSQSPPSSASV